MPHPVPPPPRRSLRPLPGTALVLLALAAAGCTPPGEEEAAAPPPPRGDAVRVEDARAFATPPGVDTGAVYLTLVNPTAEDDLLVSVSSPAAKVAEVHETVEEEGTMRMVAFPEGMPVPAASRVTFAPGGKHVMLMALAGPLVAGESIELTLHLDEAGAIPLTVPVVEPGG